MKDIEIPLDKLLESSETLVDRIPKATKKKEDIVYFAYYLSIVDLANEINFLKKNNRHNSLSILTRTFLETFVDFILLTKDFSYSNSLFMKSLTENKNQLNSLLEDPSLKGGERKTLISDLNDVTIIIEKIEPLINESNKIKNIKDKFKKTELLWLYNTVYNSLCGFSHNNISQIESRHIQQHKTGRVTLKHKIENGQIASDLFISVTKTCLIKVFETLNERKILICDDLLSSLNIN